MACSCNGSKSSFFSYNFTNSNCTSCGDNCVSDASSITYTGPNLTCLNLPTGTNLQTIIQTIDAQVCQNNTGDWANYNYYCLLDPNGETITTVQQFVEGISFAYCNLNESYTTFIDETYKDDLGDLQTQIDTINFPQLTSCAAVGIQNTDGLTAVLTKILTNLCNVNTSINPSGANWNTCYAVSPLPTTITGAFNILISQICTLKAAINAGFALPLIDNTGNCLDGSSSDSMVTTIGLLTNYVCLLPTFDVDLITFGCVTEGTDLQETLQNTISKLSTVATNYIADADPSYFTLDWVDDSNHCLGKILSFDEGLVSDRLVASNSSDLSPGTLYDKLAEGTGISLDFATSPGQVIISSSATPTYTVLTSNTDSTDGYLIEKIIGTSGSIFTVTISEDISDLSDHKTKIAVNADMYLLSESILNTINSNPTLYTIFCQMVNACTSACPAPLNLVATHPTTSTTTTTTTTIP